MAERKIAIIDTNTIEAMNLYAQEVVKRAKRNLKIKRKVEGKMRIADSSGALAKGLSYKLIKGNTSLNMLFYSSLRDKMLPFLLPFLNMSVTIL